MTDYSELRRLAEAAIAAKVEYDKVDWDNHSSTRDRPHRILSCPVCAIRHALWRAEEAAEASPDVVLALLDRIAAAADQIEALGVMAREMKAERDMALAECARLRDVAGSEHREHLRYQALNNENYLRAEKFEAERDAARDWQRRAYPHLVAEVESMMEERGFEAEGGLAWQHWTQMIEACRVLCEETPAALRAEEKPNADVS